jgi:putative ABC transport system ATP-binding protein
MPGTNAAPAEGAKSAMDSRVDASGYARWLSSKRAWAVMPVENAFFQLRNIRKVYRTGTVETTALNDVTLDIREGEFVGIMGPSGCGKSTLLNIIAMLDTPTIGRYVLGGIEVSDASESRLAEIRKGNIGFIFQDFVLIDDLSVYENVELPLLCLNVPRKKRQTRVREVLELVDLQRRAKHRPAQLSGGQQQRVAIARAVVGDPKLIVADEPTGNLDTHHGEEVMDMMTTLNRQGTTILMVTHSPVHAGRASRILNMLDGRLVSDAAQVAA